MTDLRHFSATKSAQDIYMQVRIDAGQIQSGQNRRRSKSAKKKNESTLLYLALIKKNSYAELIVLRLVVTCYIGNIIAFLHCHYAYLSILLQASYQCSITIKYCITVIAMQHL